MSLVVVGSCNLDLVVEVGRLPEPGETVLGADLVSVPGGKGANQAVAARRLGVETALVGAAGEDGPGVTLREALAREGVDIAGLATVPGPSGVALIVVDAGGENTITVAAGANRRLTAGHLRRLPARLTASSVLLTQLEIPIATCVAAAGMAADAGARVVVNAAPLSDPGDPGLRRLLAAADVVVVNQGEAAALGKAVASSTTDAGSTAGVAEWRRLAGELRALGPGAVVITLGAAGAVVADDGGDLAVPGFPVRAVDTTGAGDAFCGALAAALAEGRPLAEAVRRGCAAGALATTSLGAQAAMPAVTDVDALAATPEGN